MPKEKGFYWARVADKWFLVYWDVRQEGGRDSFARMQIVLNEDDRLQLLSVHPYEVDEWSARVLEPGEHINRV